MVLLEVPSAPHWQDVSMQLMVMVSSFCDQCFICEVDVWCVQMWTGSSVIMWAWRSFPPLFGTLYPIFYQVAHEDCSYQCQSQSQAHIPRDQGDIYYLRAFWEVG